MSIENSKLSSKKLDYNERLIRGYIMIKVQGIWKRKHVHLWEEYHRRVLPDGHYIHFIDNDKKNFNIENLQCLKRIVEPRNQVPIGSERITSKGDTKIKIADKVWQYKQVFIWEEYSKTPLPDGHEIKFIDEDKTNFAIDNLKCVPLRHTGKDPDLIKCTLLLSKLRKAICTGRQTLGKFKF